MKDSNTDLIVAVASARNLCWLRDHYLRNAIPLQPVEVAHQKAQCRAC